MILLLHFSIVTLFRFAYCCIVKWLRKATHNYRLLLVFSALLRTKGSASNYCGLWANVVSLASKNNHSRPDRFLKPVRSKQFLRLLLRIKDSTSRYCGLWTVDYRLKKLLTPDYELPTKNNIGHFLLKVVFPHKNHRKR